MINCILFQVYFQPFERSNWLFDIWKLLLEAKLIFQCSHSEDNIYLPCFNPLLFWANFGFIFWIVILFTERWAVQQQTYNERFANEKFARSTFAHLFIYSFNLGLINVRLKVIIQDDPYSSNLLLSSPRRSPSASTHDQFELLLNPSRDDFNLTFAFVKSIVDCCLSEILLELSNTATVTLNKRLNWIRVLDRISHFVLFVAAEMLTVTLPARKNAWKL